MSSKTDLRAYFKHRATGSDGPAAKTKKPNTEIIASATEHVNRAKIELVMDEVENSTARQSYNNIPKHVRMEVGKYALARSTKDALAKFSKQYPKYTFKRIRSKYTFIHPLTPGKHHLKIMKIAKI